MRRRRAEEVPKPALQISREDLAPMPALAFLSLAAPALLLPRAAAPPRCAVRCCAPVDVEPAAAPIDPRKAVEGSAASSADQVLWTESVDPTSASSGGAS